MQFKLPVVFIVSLYSTLIKHEGEATKQNKIEDVDVFNLLIGLYKINPLKASNVYKKFSQKLLNGDAKGLKNQIFEPDIVEIKNHTKPSMRQINEMEDIIHTATKQPIRHIIDNPQFNVEGSNIEKFDVNVILQNQEENHKSKNYDIDDIDGIDNIFEPLKNVENDISIELPVTKLIPVNDTVISSKLTTTKLLPKKNKYRVYRDKLEEWGWGVNDTVLYPPLSENKVGPDVIVL